MIQCVDGHHYGEDFLYLISLFVLFLRDLPAVGVGVALCVNSIYLLTSVAAFSEFNVNIFLAAHMTAFLKNVSGSSAEREEPICPT